jgi:hypothetical protein
VTGRVLAADTRQPLADVQVIRQESTSRGDGTAEPGKGGAALMSAPLVMRTDREGRFVLDAERVLAPLWGASWYSVDLIFQCPGYQRFQTNYNLLNLGTNSLQSQSALSTGDILLQPARK